MSPTETVLCIKSENIERKFEDFGFIPASSINLNTIFEPKEVWFAPRETIENEPKFKQIIPYIIIKSNESILMYKRSSRGKETRLHDKWALGFGGHITLQDVVFSGNTINFSETVQTATERELKEEINLGVIKSQEFIGFINDNSSSVSRVHFGIVGIWTLDQTHFETLEENISDCQLCPIKDIKNFRNQFEQWSKLCEEFLSK